jgi:hypothetical protein
MEATQMGARPSQQVIKRRLNRLARTYVGVEFRVLYASNGETAILPINPETGEPELTNPQRFVVKNLWNKACTFDKIDPQSTFVAFSDKNPFLADYNEAMGELQRPKPITSKDSAFEIAKGLNS